MQYLLPRKRLAFPRNFIFISFTRRSDHREAIRSRKDSLTAVPNTQSDSLPLIINSMSKFLSTDFYGDVPGSSGRFVEPSVCSLLGTPSFLKFAKHECLLGKRPTQLPNGSDPVWWSDLPVCVVVSVLRRASTVLMKPCLSHHPLFSHSGSVSPWVTVARLQARPERLAVWVTAPPPQALLPTLSYKEVLTTLALLFGPQNIPQPPIRVFAEKGRAKLKRAEQRRLLEGGGVCVCVRVVCVCVCGWAPVGSVVSVWALVKERIQFLLTYGCGLNTCLCLNLENVTGLFFKLKV